MKSPNLTEAQIAGIAAVLDGTKDKFEDVNVCPDAVERHLRSIGLKPGELDTNGWDYDWWLPFEGTKGDQWMASGSGYYGTFEFNAAEE